MSERRLLSPGSELSPQDCPAFILAGGLSSRFGSDKALVPVDGQPLLLKLRETLLAQSHAVSIVADRAERYQQLGLRCCVDYTSDCGPLAGVATSLRQRLELGPGWTLILSCDQLVWRGEWFEHLARQTMAAEHGVPPCRGVHFISRDATGKLRPEPLPCLLHTCLLPVVLERLQHRQLSLQGLLNNASIRQLNIQAGPKQWSFNTPEELRKLSGSTAL